MSPTMKTAIGIACDRIRHGFIVACNVLHFESAALCLQCVHSIAPMRIEIGIIYFAVLLEVIDLGLLS